MANTRHRGIAEMGIIQTVKRWFDMIFKNQAEDDFKVESAGNPAMDALISRCANIYLGNPEWLDLKDGIRTINFAKTICSETARLAMLATSITISRISPRGMAAEADRCGIL